MKKRTNAFKIKLWYIIIATLLLLLPFIPIQSFDFLYRASATAFLIILFFIADSLFNLEFKTRHYAYITLISLAGNLFFPIYFIFPHYDKLLHLTLPILFAAIIFHNVDKLKLDLKWKLTFTFFIVIGSNAIFEIGEFLLDQFTNLKLQGVYQWTPDGSGGLNKLELILDLNTDTMIDMMLGVLGTLLYVLTIGLIRRNTKKPRSRKR